MVRIREHVHIIILDAGKVESIEQGQAVLKVHVVIGDAVHEQESDVLLEGRHIGDSGIVESVRIVCGRVHVTLGVDAVVEAPVGDGCDRHPV
jgi:cell shape-determining protein MreC